MKKNETINLLTPICRLVQGSLYDRITQDIDGNPFKIKTGKDVGKERGKYYFGVAIKKGEEKHWNETAWGKQLWDFVISQSSAAIVSKKDFSWKIEDGDSEEPNRNERRNCDRDGFPGNWIIKFSTFIAPQLVNEKCDQITQDHFIQLGYFVQVYFSAMYNNPANKPNIRNGVFLNPEIVSFQAYGEVLTQYVRPDPKSIGFGGKLPKGASQVPISQLDNGTDEEILDPVVFGEESEPDVPKPPSSPSRSVRKASKGGHTWELDVLINNGWTEADLVNAGYIFS